MFCLVCIFIILHLIAMQVCSKCCCHHALSVLKANGTNQSGYLTCNECYSLQSKVKRVPLFAIANGKTIGGAPPCLSSLYPVELALISKARI